MPALDLLLATLLLVTAAPVSASRASDADADGDGLSDVLEQSLIERFRPRFHVSADDCAGLPARFEPFELVPTVQERDGTLYARVSRSRIPATGSGHGLEIHYYHLWDRDCGPMSSHGLDVEHVSVLVTTPQSGTDADDWLARYWYAAAHEDTICDTSNAARAAALGAETKGPDVYVSRGKHASYLSRELCGQRGCGVDSCRELVPMPAGAIVNIGERSAPLAGSTWIASRAWNLEEKLGADFDPSLVDRLEAHPSPVVVRVNGHRRATQFSLSIGSDALGALGEAGSHGGGGVVEAKEQTGSALGKTFRAVGRALGRVIGLGGSPE